MAVATVQADSGSARTMPMEWGQGLRFWLWLQDGTHGINGDFGRGVWGKRRVQPNCSSVQSLKERSDLLSPGWGGAWGGAGVGLDGAPDSCRACPDGRVWSCTHPSAYRCGEIAKECRQRRGRPHPGPRALLEVCKG